jgi:glutaredoxin
MNKDTKTYLILAVIVTAIILGIYLFKGEYLPGDEKTMKCIAEKSVIYTQPGCGHCETQKEILGDYYYLFKDINCITDRDKCAEAGITGTPTWIINEEAFEGVQTIEELKELTGC